MGPLIPIGNRFAVLALLLASFSGIAYTQSSVLVCAPSAESPLVRAEGVAERMGDILIPCKGGTPNAAFTASLAVFLPVSVTNRVTAAAAATDAVLSIDTGAGPVASGISGIVSANSIAFNGIHFLVPAGGLVTLRVSNIRANMSEFAGGSQTPVAALLSGSAVLGALAIPSTPLNVAFPLPGLLASTSRSDIPCTGSPLPSAVSMSGLFSAGTSFVSTRLTEGFVTAFQSRESTADTGTRIRIAYSGLPAGVHLYVPDAIAGSSAAVPTAGGDLGVAQSGGQYAAGSGTLLLSRVLNPNPDGSRGQLAFAPSGAGPFVLDGAGEVPLAGGSGYAVYEVLDFNPLARESAQFPTFVAWPDGPRTVVPAGRESILFAPVSNAPAASATAPVPRFVEVAPGRDCPALGDCGASFFPHLSVMALPMRFTATAGGAAYEAPGYIPVRNATGGVMNWTASVTYQSGAGWIQLDHPTGINNGSVRVFVKPQQLAAGNYSATVTIDAGSAGSYAVPVTLVVSALPQPPGRTPPLVSSVVNAASFQEVPLVPGSLASVFGDGLAGKDVSVTFDGAPAALLYISDGQINLQVPPALGAAASAQVVVEADGVPSAPFRVGLAQLSPAVFSHGVLNQDNTVNGGGSPAAPGTVIQIFATGLPDDGAGVFAKIDDRDNLVPLYAGAAPTLLGVQQVNVAVPADLAGSSATLLVCGTGPGGQRMCSPAFELAIGE